MVPDGRVRPGGCRAATATMPDAGDGPRPGRRAPGGRVRGGGCRAARATMPDARYGPRPGSRAIDTRPRSGGDVGRGRMANVVLIHTVAGLENVFGPLCDEVAPGLAPRHVVDESLPPGPPAAAHRAAD